MWNAEASSLVLRLYASPGGFARRDPFIAVAFVKTVGAGTVFIEGALRTDGNPLSVTNWRDMIRLLRRDYGVRLVTACHKGMPLEIKVTAPRRV